MTDDSNLVGGPGAERFAHSGHAQKWLFRSRTELYEAYNAANRVVGLPLSPEETEALAATWSKRAADLAAKLKLSIPVQATAALFALRFYTKVAFTEVKPPALQGATVLLAAKTQEGYKFLQMMDLIVKLVQETKVKNEEILAAEARLMQTMEFDLLVFLPIDATNFFTTEFLRSIPVNDTVQVGLSEVERTILSQTFSMTVSQLYTPAQIALAVLATSVAKLSSSKVPELASQFDSWLSGILAEKPNSEDIKTAINSAQVAIELSSQAMESLYKTALAKCNKYKHDQKQQQGVGVSVKKEP